MRKISFSMPISIAMRKLSPLEPKKFTSYILPKKPRFDDMVSKLKILFGTTESVGSRRYRCLQVKRQVTEGYKTSSLPAV